MVTEPTEESTGTAEAESTGEALLEELSAFAEEAKPELLHMEREVLEGLAAIGDWPRSAPQPPTVEQVLVDAHGLLAVGWSAMTVRRALVGGTVRELYCEPLHPDACAWSVEDALLRAAGGDAELTQQALRAVEAQGPGRHGLLLWQSSAGRTGAEVLALVKRAAYKATVERNAALHEGR